MKAKSMIRVGAWGSGITALCCFTPLLVVGLGIAGLSALTVYLDAVLLPLLAMFVVCTLWGLLRLRQAAQRKQLDGKPSGESVGSPHS